MEDSCISEDWPFLKNNKLEAKKGPQNYDH